jgi:hypothetical protein
LKLNVDVLLSNCAIKFNLRHHSEVAAAQAGAAADAAALAALMERMVGRCRLTPD